MPTTVFTSFIDAGLFPCGNVSVGPGWHALIDGVYVSARLLGPNGEKLACYFVASSKRHCDIRAYRSSKSEVLSAICVQKRARGELACGNQAFIATFVV